MSFKVESNEIKQSQEYVKAGNTLTGNGTHISIVPLAPNSHAQIHIQLAPILIITPLNTSGMIRPRHLQQPHTSLDPIHDKVSPELVLFLFGAYKLGSSQSVQMAGLTHTHDGQHSEVSREAQNAARWDGRSVPVPLDIVETKLGREKSRIHYASDDAGRRWPDDGCCECGRHTWLFVGNVAPLCCDE